MKLILIGGNEWRRDDGIDAYLAHSFQRIGLIPWASEEHDRKIREFAKTYAAFDKEVKVVDSASDLGDLDLVYLGGGDPAKLLSEIQRRKLAESLLANWQAGRVAIAGSSAGAMVLFAQMSAHDEHLAEGSMPALGFIKGKFLVIPHWEKADQLWKDSLKKEFPDHLIIGIDENTALSIHDSKATVLGLGRVNLSGTASGVYTSGDTFNLDLGV